MSKLSEPMRRALESVGDGKVRRIHGRAGKVFDAPLGIAANSLLALERAGLIKDGDDNKRWGRAFIATVELTEAGRERFRAPS